ncbi:TetR family transcriptional regulator [Streptomyces eurocidicus]|uniref:AcrR family transcriptional regulator n=1 Tax=Streptomyces eurocidicus TaxID=66423 RepID=A0A2N8NWD2_STREU|nr:TetR/AcrR family transcriptional regulator [Streptomyces eurocidicus]MBB5122191.1 AcrR family transcriptional regulator [Streptomyces eurocidicus]MBF6055539.1 TetR family transcriptional regulator [Streptomyces eurocidicus]PNE33080.1 TetR family transcriptional regulator [Streptomyces eurocidicus]
MEDIEAEDRLLDAAETLFYGHGVQAVGMDRIRAASGVSLKRLYQCFASKEELVEAYLRRRDRRWRGALAAHVAAVPSAAVRPLAVFDWLEAWFGEPDFRGCAFINAFGEMGAGSAAVAEAARDHKAEVRGYLLGLVRAAGATDPEPLADQLALVVDGAITTAAVTGAPEAAARARDAAAVLLAAAGVTGVNTEGREKTRGKRSRATG